MPLIPKSLILRIAITVVLLGAAGLTALQLRHAFSPATIEGELVQSKNMLRTVFDRNRELSDEVEKLTHLQAERLKQLEEKDKELKKIESQVTGQVKLVKKLSKENVRQVKTVKELQKIQTQERPGHEASDYYIPVRQKDSFLFHEPQKAEWKPFFFPQREAPPRPVPEVKKVEEIEKAEEVKEVKKTEEAKKVNISLSSPKSLVGDPRIDSRLRGNDKIAEPPAKVTEGIPAAKPVDIVFKSAPPVAEIHDEALDDVKKEINKMARKAEETKEVAPSKNIEDEEEEFFAKFSEELEGFKETPEPVEVQSDLPLETKQSVPYAAPKIKKKAEIKPEIKLEKKPAATPSVILSPKGEEFSREEVLAANTSASPSGRIDGGLHSAKQFFKAAAPAPIISSVQTVVEIKKSPPAKVIYWYNLGVQYTEERKFGKAARMYERALKLDPRDAPSHYNLGILYDNYLRKPEKGIQHYRAFLRLSQDVGKSAKVKDWLDLAIEGLTPEGEGYYQSAENNIRHTLFTNAK